MAGTATATAAGGNRVGEVGNTIRDRGVSAIGATVGSRGATAVVRKLSLGDGVTASSGGSRAVKMSGSVGTGAPGVCAEVGLVTSARMSARHGSASRCRVDNHW
ncbi:hypothetical protein MHU86_2155 [Fragilaria crotonensis]|nr:hypothetical protein MHU86_2155 [Fragilaria crotonensis]